MSDGNLYYCLWAIVLFALAVGRSILVRRHKLDGLFDVLGWIEIGVLGLLLLTLVVLGILQIVLRNFFHSGLLWADPLMRHCVLWLGCLGATLATTSVRHINIDVFSRLLPARVKPLQRSVVYLATSLTTFMLGVAAWRLVLDERQYGDIAFGSVPVWVLQLVLPVAFFLICYRSLVNLLVGRQPESMEEGLEVTDP